MNWLSSLYQMFGHEYEYPYTDFSQINLDFVLHALVEIGEAIESLTAGLATKAQAPHEIVYTVEEATNLIEVTNINMNHARFFFKYKGTGSSPAVIAVTFRSGATSNIVNTGSITSFVTSGAQKVYYLEALTHNAVFSLIFPESTSTSATLKYKTYGGTPDNYPEDQKVDTIRITLTSSGATFNAGSKLFIKGV